MGRYPHHHRIGMIAGLFVLLVSQFPVFSNAESTSPFQTTVPVGGSPLFIQNVGQFAEPVRFKVWGTSGELFLTDDALWFVVNERLEEDAAGLHRLGQRAMEEGWREQPRRAVALKLSFPGANLHPTLEPSGRLETSVNYFIGNDPAQWRTNVPVWSGVRYRDLYPDIDLEIAAEGGQVVPRLVARPGADLDAVRLRVEGANSIELLPSPAGGRGAGGEGLLLTTAAGDFTLPLLQVVAPDGSPLLVSGEGPVVRANEITAPFAAASPPLPSSARGGLLYATFLGRSGSDCSFAIAADGSGAAYVTGYTNSSNFPTTPGAFDPTYNGSSDAFVVKLNPSGSGLLYATFLGGSDGDYGEAIAVDGSGAAYVTGHTFSSNFPTTPGAFDTTHNGGEEDAFVVRLSPSGSGLTYATFLGGSDWDYGEAIAVDGSGAAYVTGYTESSDFPTTPGAFDRTHNGYADAFVVMLNASGSSLTYATFLGGSSKDWSHAIAVDGSGAAYVTGYTESSDFPTTSGAFDTTYNGGSVDTFVVKFSFLTRIYLPLVLRDYLTYFEGPWEVEPNNTYLEANGPLRSGRDYYGYPNDEKDYFSICVRRSGTITIDLSNHTGQGVQLQLFYQSLANRVAYDLDPPYRVTYNGQPGRYYIYLYTAGGYNQTTPYTLRATFPE